MRGACTPPPRLSEDTQELVPPQEDRSGATPPGVVLSPLLEVVAEQGGSSRPSVVLLSRRSDDKEKISLTRLNGAEHAAPSRFPPPLTRERLLTLQHCASDDNLVALATANATVLRDKGGQAGTIMAAAIPFGDHTNHVDTQRHERVMSWLAGTSASPSCPLESTADDASGRVLEGSGVSEGPHTPSRPVASAAGAPFDALKQTLLLPRSGSGSVSLRSPTRAEPSPSGVVPLWCALGTRTPARYSLTERDEDGDDSTPSARRSAPLQRTKLLGRNSDYRSACYTPPSASRHPWIPSELHECNAEEVAVTASHRLANSTARDSPRRTPPLVSLLLPFMASPPRQPSVARDFAKKCPAPSVALSEAVDDAKYRKMRQTTDATSSHSDGENAIALRVCTLSGVTLRVTVDRCSSVAALAQRVAQYLQLRGAQVQLKYTRTGEVFEAVPFSIKEPKTSSTTRDLRLCDLPGLQPSDVFVVLLRAQRGEPSSSPLPTRLSEARWAASRSPSPTPSSASSRVHPPRLHHTAAKRPRHSTLTPPMPTHTIAESPPALAGAHAAGGVSAGAPVPSRKAHLPSVSGRRSSRIRSPLGTSPVVRPGEKKHRRPGVGMRSLMTHPVSVSSSAPAPAPAPAAAPAARAVSTSQAAALPATSAYAANGPEGEAAVRASAGSYCYPPLTRSHTHQG
ncbi:hypothetical protein GH5_08550 [Leishmania sp. Ghana 2012 LV757]|uniref:uncharacterized protein n=1 Tax=Leishmania sp. Ghana 2012 LV757 TaxID=2803181 RepID=UPI001B48B1CB|nr:hypothetical protein GH5_08550 [Leishmania sp. Ghana 2012 LV757]